MHVTAQQPASRRPEEPGRAAHGDGAVAAPASSPLGLQRSIGNQAFQRLLRARGEGRDGAAAPSASPRTSGLVVGARDDVYERQAERVAAQAAGGPGPRAQRAPSTSTGPSVAPPVVHEVLAGPGRPLDPAARGFLEPRLGADLGGVRVHTGARAAQSARAVGALAYTVGRDVVFGAGQYAPETQAGRRVLAHELAHVVQQGAGAPAALRRIATPECDADQGKRIGKAVDSAQANLRTVIAALGARPLTPDMQNALWLYFRDSSEATAVKVTKELTSILNVVGGLSYECENDCAEEMLGYVRLGTMVTGLGSIHLCMNSLGDNADKLTDTIVHEVAHYELYATDSAGYFGDECGESETTVGAGSATRLDLADSYRCFVRNWVSGNAADRADAKGDLTGANLRIDQAPVGPIDLNAKDPRKPMFFMKLSRGPLAFVPGVSYRWVLRDPQDRSYKMTDRKGELLFQYRPALESVSAIINAATRALLKERGVTSGRVLCRASSPVFGERLFELPVTFTL